MKKPSTTQPGTSSKQTDLSQADNQTVEQIRSALCPEALAKAHYVQNLVRCAPRLRTLFRQARMALLKFELEAVSGLSGDTSLNDYDESMLNRQRRCEQLLSEIDLLLTGLSFEAQHNKLPIMSEDERNLVTKLRHDFPFETH